MIWKDVKDWPRRGKQINHRQDSQSLLKYQENSATKLHEAWILRIRDELCLVPLV